MTGAVANPSPRLCTTAANRLAPLFLLATAVSALNTVFFKRMMNSYRSSSPAGEKVHDYSVFVSVFCILLWAILMSGLARVGGWMGDPAIFPRRGVRRAAAIDQVGTLLAALGGSHVPGQAQVLLNQAVLPVTMLITSAQGRRYSAREVLGAALVLTGASVVALPAAIRETAGDPALSFLQQGVVLFSLAQVAHAVANLMKEGLLSQAASKRSDRGLVDGRGALASATEDAPLSDPITLGVSLAWVRVPLGVLLSFAIRRGAGDVLQEFRNGWRCFCGEMPDEYDLGCPEAARSTLLSVSMYATQTVLGLRLTQRGSATLRSIAVVTAVPLAQLLFTSEKMMSHAGAEQLETSSVVGLGLCLLGFAVYLQSRANG